MAIGWDSSVLKDTKKKFDANDYSRFDQIGVEDSLKCDLPEIEACRNCSKAGAKLKCSICKKASYCTRECQKGDWTYHKRICKKPEEKKDKTKGPEKKNVPSSPSTTLKSKPGSKKKPQDDVLQIDEDDEELLKGLQGYKYFHRKPTDTVKELIGDIAPKPVSASGVGNVAASTAAAAEENKTHQGSAWNSAGTFEEKDYSFWAKEKFELLLTTIRVSGTAALPLSDDGVDDDGVQVWIKGVKKVTGDASICVVRGKKRYLYDFSLELELEARDSTGKHHMGKMTCDDVSNDGEKDIRISWTKKLSAQVSSEISPVVTSLTSPLQLKVIEQLDAFEKLFLSL